MGYKLAGFQVVGANDIDPAMGQTYRINHKPDLFIESPINELISRLEDADALDGLRGIDVLDGSPPCSTFSTMSVRREEDWGVEKRFREGQAKQVLSDLFFDFLDVVAALQPKAVIAENVTGLIAGRAKGYVRLIFARLRELGYSPQLFVLNAADFGTPQARRRVFVVAAREELGLAPLSVRTTTRSCPVSCSDAFAGVDASSRQPPELTPVMRMLWNRTPPGETLGEAYEAYCGKAGAFSHTRLDRGAVAPTLVASNGAYHYSEPRRLSEAELFRLGSFPDDYQSPSYAISAYLVGMSVPPFLMAGLARQVRTQWFAEH